MPGNKTPLRAVALLITLFIWLIMNIRVEAGIATPLERALDGLVGGTLVLFSIYLAWVFFSSGGPKSDK